MFCSNFTPWHDKYFSDANHHGNYNGMNIAGLDVASFLIAKNKNQALTIPEFVSSMPPFLAIRSKKEYPNCSSAIRGCCKGNTIETHLP
jgi:hypothetical protein